MSTMPLKYFLFNIKSCFILVVVTLLVAIQTQGVLKMFKIKCVKKVFMYSFFVLILLVMFNCKDASAAEAGPINFPAGSSGVMIGQAPPFPGLFLDIKTSYTSSKGMYDGSGNKIDGYDWNMNAYVETVRIIPRYSFKLLGATLYSQLVIPMVYVESSLSVQGHEVFDESESGIGNITITPLIMEWQKGIHRYTLGLDIATEIGTYDKNKNANPASGYNSIIPVLAYRYNDPKGLDFGLKISPLFNLENTSTDYKTGTILTVENCTAWNFGALKIGIVGGYTQQLEGDELEGSDIGNKMKHLNVGPSITYQLGRYMINMNYQKGIIAENTTMNDAFYISVSMPAFMPKH